MGAPGSPICAAPYRPGQEAWVADFASSPPRQNLRDRPPDGGMRRVLLVVWTIRACQMGGDRQRRPAIRPNDSDVVARAMSASAGFVADPPSFGQAGAKLGVARLACDQPCVE